MVRFIGLILSITLQIVAAFIALRLIKLTKYRLSWILISFGLTFMALRRVVDIIVYINGDITYEITIFNDWMGILISFLLLGGVLYIREIFYSLKKAELDRIRSERKVLNAIIQTEEKERMRFAKELHDGLGPLLSTVKMSISALLKRKTGENDKEIIRNADMVIDEAISSIKEISNNISPHILTNFGLASALKSFVNKINLTKTINIYFFSNMETERLDRNIEIVLYRVVCELINNTIKHANASKIDISLNKFNQLISLHYKDDGKGFNVEKVLNGHESGMGYANIKSRVNSINGIFVLESNEEGGTNAIITVEEKY